MLYHLAGRGGVTRPLHLKRFLGGLRGEIQSHLPQSKWVTAKVVRGALVGSVLLECSLRAGAASAAGSPSQASGAQASVGMSSTTYFSAPASSLGSTYSSFQAQWSGETSGQLFDAQARAELLLTVNNSAYRNGEIPYAYLQTREGAAPFRVAIGRKSEPWSELDSTWNLGIFQPRFKSDFLRPEPVGLIGAFFEWKGPALRVLAYGSPIFVPERGTPLELQNGSFEPGIPWAVVPPATLNVLGKETSAQYEIKTPKASELLMNAGGGLLVRWGEEQGPWTSAAFAFKPVNQLLIGLDGRLALSDSSAPRARIDLYPRVAYHRVSSLEAGYRSELLEGWVSALRDDPVRDRTPAEWTTQELSPAWAVSPGLKLKLSPFRRQSTELKLSYLREWGGDAVDQGRFASPGSRMFEARYPYQDAWSLGVRTSFPGATGSRITATADSIIDVRNRGTIFSTEFRYQALAAWQVNVGADFLGSSRKTGEGGSGTDFISRYQANDRVRGGVSYAF